MREYVYVTLVTQIERQEIKNCIHRNASSLSPLPPRTILFFFLFVRLMYCNLVYVCVCVISILLIFLKA